MIVNKPNDNLNFKEIKYIKEWVNIDVIEVKKGYSQERKFLVRNLDSNEKVLVRTCEIKMLNDKKFEFEKIKLLNSTTNEITMTRVIDVGAFNDGLNCWTLTNWIDGDDFNDVLKEQSPEKQYQLGIKAGKLLKLFHSIEIPESMKLNLYNRDNLERKLRIVKEYEENLEIRFKGDEELISYVKLNFSKAIENQNVVLKHSDFHTGNMILTEIDKDFALIDFNRCSFGFAYEEFQRIQAFSKYQSIPFSVGQINGYFDGEPPESFWATFATFVHMSSISMIHWAESYGIDEVNNMKGRVLNSIQDFQNFNSNIPLWYINFNKNKNL